jgi:hypothetical protein
MEESKNIRLPSSMMAELKAEAQKKAEATGERVTVSNIIRHAIFSYLKDKKKK